MQLFSLLPAALALAATASATAISTGPTTAEAAASKTYMFDANVTDQIEACNKFNRACFGLARKGEINSMSFVCGSQQQSESKALFLQASCVRRRSLDGQGGSFSLSNNAAKIAGFREVYPAPSGGCKYVSYGECARSEFDISPVDIS